MEREFEPSLPTINISELYAIYTMLDIIIIDIYAQNSLLGGLVSQTMANITDKCKILDNHPDSIAFKDTIQKKLIQTLGLQLQMLSNDFDVINIRRYMPT